MNATLARALSPLLPTARQTLLLRTCLLSGEAAGTAWSAFSARTPDPIELFRTDRGRLKRLSPLLLRALRREETPADRELLTVLRTAHLREELRARAYRRILRSVLRAMGDREIPFLLLGGAVLGETVYPEPLYRHSHDIDLLIRPGDRAAAAGALAGAGFAADEDDPFTDPDEDVHLHRSGLPVRLHARLFRSPHHRVGREGLWRRRRRLDVAGERVHGPSPADALLHVLGHAALDPAGASLLWACDARLITEAASDLDWDRLVGQAAASRLSVPVALMLEYLSSELEAPVPRDALDRLASKARSAGRLERDLALSAARRKPGDGLRATLGSVSGVREKLQVASWILFPSADYIRWAHGVDARPRVWLAYLLRPLSVLAGRLRSSLRPGLRPASGGSPGAQSSSAPP